MIKLCPACQGFSGRRGVLQFDQFTALSEAEEQSAPTKNFSLDFNSSNR